MAIRLLKPRLMRWGTLSVTDHNRSPLEISVERIENSKRMANGTMRKYHVADKRTFSASWDMLPNSAQFTVDGHAGADEMETFYDANPQDFDLKISYGVGPEETFRVMFTDFSKTLSKRGKFDFYELSVTMEEV